VQIGDEVIQLSAVVRDLGVPLDSELSMKPHISIVAASCFYHLRRLRQIRWRVGKEVTTRLVIAFITSRLDYCNSVLAGLPQATLEPRQRVQLAAVRLILELNMRDHLTPGLIQLLWLPIRYHVQFKLCSIMQSIHVSRCPAYMADCVRSVVGSATRSGLCSAESALNFTLKLRSMFGERYISHAGPAAWNPFPSALREVAVYFFRNRLKRTCFNLAFK